MRICLNRWLWKEMFKPSQKSLALLYCFPFAEAVTCTTFMHLKCNRAYTYTKT